jgi:hypothetical protein
MHNATTSVLIKKGVHPRVETARRAHATLPNLLRNGRGGSNLTFNLLIFDQQPTNQWFQRFPNHFRSHKWADLGKVVT